jgi:2-iminobutanoate/2-iminopropanoate deaminase
VSGTAPHDPQTGALVGATIQEQTRQCLRNIAAILESAGSSLDKIASVTVVLADEQDFQGMNEEWLKWFPSNPPARQGAKLPVKIPGLKVSIAAIAEASQSLEGAVMRLRLGASGAEKLCALGALGRSRAAPQLHR